MSRKSENEIVIVEVEVSLDSIESAERFLKATKEHGFVRVSDWQKAHALLETLCREARIENA